MKSSNLLTAVLLIVSFACEVAPAYQQPPVGSYASSTRQMRIGDTRSSVQEAAVTPDFFGAAAVQPLIGRFFVNTDYGSSPTRVVVLSYDLWAERFGSSPAIIGQNIELDGVQTVVVGIAPRGFSIPEATLLWTPK